MNAIYIPPKWSPYSDSPMTSFCLYWNRVINRCSTFYYLQRIVFLFLLTLKLLQFTCMSYHYSSGLFSFFLSFFLSITTSSLLSTMNISAPLWHRQRVVVVYWCVCFQGYPCHPWVFMDIGCLVGWTSWTWIFTTENILGRCWISWPSKIRRMRISTCWLAHILCDN